MAVTMLSGVKDFLSRHKRKFIVTGVVIGGATLAVQYAQRKLEAWGQQEAMDIIERARRLQHFESMDSACNSTICTLVPSVFESTLKTADCEKHVIAIRNNEKKGKLQVWEVLKVEVISRVLLQMCAGAMIVILLKIQLNIVGACMLKEKQHTPEMQRKYLVMCNSFMSDKIKDLYSVIRACVDTVLSDKPLTERMSVTETEKLLWMVYNRLRTEQGNPVDNMSYYLIPPESWITSADNLSNEDVRQLHSLMADTKDLLDSAEVKHLMNLLTSSGSGYYTDGFLPFFARGQPSNETDRVPTDEEVWSFNAFGTVPFARLIGSIQGATKEIRLFSSWINLLLDNQTLKMFSANIYEAFGSQP